jgi:hypothetical protein
MNNSTETRSALGDDFDRTIRALTGLPDVLHTNASTVRAMTPFRRGLAGLEFARGQPSMTHDGQNFNYRLDSSIELEFDGLLLDRHLLVERADSEMLTKVHEELFPSRVPPRDLDALTIRALVGVREKLRDLALPHRTSEAGHRGSDSEWLDFDQRANEMANEYRSRLGLPQRTREELLGTRL